MRPPTAALLLAALALGGGPPVPGGRRLRMFDPPEPQDHGPRAVACPRCGAQPGEPCDRRTLRAHTYHQARVLRAKETP